MATIFMLHRVCDLNNNRLFANQNMNISPIFLENFIIDLKLKGYEFISLDQLYDLLVNEKNVKNKIVFTLDDGYLDNYTVAYPIFKKHNVPFTVYITTSFPENEAILWWYILEDLILSNSFLQLGNSKTYECITMVQKESVFLEIRNIILSFKKEKFLDSLTELFCNYNIDWFAKNAELCMGWNHIVELSKDINCTIGGHTKSHYALNQLTFNEIQSEIVQANNLIESKISKKIEHFAYPFGSKFEVGLREFEIVKRLGFKTSTTTRRGTIYQEHKNFLECLPRIMLVENFDIRDAGLIRKTRVVTI